MNAAEALAKGLKTLRKRHGLSQAQLAEGAGLHAQYISQVERRARQPTLDTIDKISVALNVTAAELLAIGETGQRKAAKLSDRIEALLSTWTLKDQDKLIKVLIELRGLAPSKAGRTARRRS